jgi:hypothetical protein
VIHELSWVVTNPTIAKAICATCLLSCVVQVWSSDVVIDGEVNVKEDVPCRRTGSGVKDRKRRPEGRG